MRLHFSLGLSLSLSIFVLGCGRPDFTDDEIGETEDATDSSEGSSSSASESTDSESESSSTDESTDGEGESSSTDESTSTADESTSSESTSTDESTSSESTSTDTNDPEGLPAGASCSDDVECASQQCYVIPFLGGQCGECNEDDDCPLGGCTSPNPFDDTPIGPVCNQGQLGGGCETDVVCQADLACVAVFDIAGIIGLQTCGECTSALDCNPGQLCAPLVQIFTWSGASQCIAPGSLALDQFCQLGPTGDQACASGICSVVDVMGLDQIGACGQCQDDGDCNGGSCNPGQLAIDTGILSGSTCQ
ncbi:hypothetical protein ACNOYE_17155 [Nannocystaceae bacterium ST9]